VIFRGDPQRGAPDQLELVSLHRNQRQIRVEDVRRQIQGAVAELEASVYIEQPVQQDTPHRVIQIGLESRGDVLSANQLALKWRFLALPIPLRDLTSTVRDEEVIQFLVHIAVHHLALHDRLERLWFADRFRSPSFSFSFVLQSRAPTDRLLTLFLLLFLSLCFPSVLPQLRLLLLLLSFLGIVGSVRRQIDIFIAVLLSPIISPLPGLLWRSHRSLCSLGLWFVFFPRFR